MEERVFAVHWKGWVDVIVGSVPPRRVETKTSIMTTRQAFDLGPGYVNVKDVPHKLTLIAVRFVGGSIKRKLKIRSFVARTKLWFPEGEVKELTPEQARKALTIRKKKGTI